MKISKGQIIRARFQVVSSVLFLALVQGHCGSKTELRKFDECGLIFFENSLCELIKSPFIENTGLSLALAVYQESPLREPTGKSTGFLPGHNAPALVDR